MNEQSISVNTSQPPQDLAVIKSLVEFASKSLIYANTGGVPRYAANPSECNLSKDEVLEDILSRLDRWRNSEESTWKKKCKEKDDELDYLKSRVSQVANPFKGVTPVGRVSTENMVLCLY